MMHADRLSYGIPEPRGNNLAAIWLRSTALAVAVILTIVLSPMQDARAEVDEIRLARPFGIAFLQMGLMDHLQLIQKHAEKAGIELEVEWRRFSSGTAMNEALISGNLDVASGSPTAFSVIWDKTGGRYVGLSAMTSMPAVLMTRRNDINSVRDLDDSDRIAVVGRSALQSVVLRMFAAKEYGDDNYQKLDHFTVIVPHNEAMSSLLSGKGEVTGHFTAAPFYQHETAAGMHRALDSYEVFGGSHTYGMIWVAQKFVDDNPKVAQVLLDAIAEATDYINKDPQGAAQAYIDSANSKLKLDFVEAILRDPKNVFTMTPENIMKYHTFMRHIGMVKRKADSWKDMFSPTLHHLPGS